MNYDAVKAVVLSKLQDGLSDQLFYHNVEHTLSVMASTQVLITQLGFDESESVIMLTAALFHDTGYLTQYEDNEEVGVSFLQKILPDFSYSPIQIEQVSRIVSDTSLRKTCTSLHSQVVRDADLSYLGSGDYNERAQALRNEFSAYGKSFTDESWLELQIKFLESHQFFTSAAKNLYEVKKNEHLETLIKMKENSYE